MSGRVRDLSLIHHMDEGEPVELSTYGRGNERSTVKAAIERRGCGARFFSYLFERGHPISIKEGRVRDLSLIHHMDEGEPVELSTYGRGNVRGEAR